MSPDSMDESGTHPVLPVFYPVCTVHGVTVRVCGHVSLIGHSLLSRGFPHGYVPLSFWRTEVPESCSLPSLNLRLRSYHTLSLLNSNRIRNLYLPVRRCVRDVSFPLRRVRALGPFVHKTDELILRLSRDDVMLDKSFSPRRVWRLYPFLH